MEKFRFGLIGTETEYGLQVHHLPPKQRTQGLAGAIPRRVMEINGAVQSAGINIGPTGGSSSWLYNDSILMQVILSLQLPKTLVLGQSLTLSLGTGQL